MEKRFVDIAVLSDIHLGTYGCHATEVTQYLKSISPRMLVLNGDIIDGWQFSKRYFPISHINVIKQIMSMISNGVRVVYITGNHDEMLRRYTDVQIGDFLLTDKYVMEIDGKTAWFFHGDVFDSTTKGGAKILAKLGGHGYDLLILINRAINFCLKMVGRDKMSFSKKVKNGVKKAVSWIADFEQTAAELAISKKYDYVICGHIHQPQKRVVQTKDGSVTYLNSGDWVENLTSLEFANGEWNLFHYDESTLKTRDTTNDQVNKKMPELNVVTDEISLFINSLFTEA